MAKFSVAKVEQKVKVIIGIDKSNEQVLALDQDESLELEFDTIQFKKLDSETVDQLKRETKRKYWIAEAKVEEAKKAEGKVQLVENPLGNSSGMYADRQKVRFRRGWHTYWAAPGADFERCMGAGPYMQVRNPTEEQKKNGYVAGEENGEVKKIMNTDNKVEAIALECPEEAYQQYLTWMDQQSSLRFGGIKTDYYNKVEDINRGLKGRGAKIIPGETNEDGRFEPLS